MVVGRLTTEASGQVRMYPRELSQGEILAVQDMAKWPDGTRVKECKEKSDDSFQDSPEVDAQVAPRPSDHGAAGHACRVSVQHCIPPLLYTPS